GRIAVEVCKLRQALAGFDFGEMAATPFVEQSADQPSLDQDDARNQRELPAVLFPDARLTKQNLASRRQVALANPPAPHSAPIEFGLSVTERLRPDIAGLLSAKDANGYNGGKAAKIENRMHRTAHDLLTKKSVVIGKNGSTG